MLYVFIYKFWISLCVGLLTVVSVSISTFAIDNSFCVGKLMFNNI